MKQVVFAIMSCQPSHDAVLVEVKCESACTLHSCTVHTCLQRLLLTHQRTRVGSKQRSLGMVAERRYASSRVEPREGSSQSALVAAALARPVSSREQNHAHQSRHGHLPTAEETRMAHAVHQLRIEMNETVNGRLGTMTSISTAILNMSACSPIISKPYRISALIPRHC